MRRRLRQQLDLSAAPAPAGALPGGSIGQRALPPSTSTYDSRNLQTVIDVFVGSMQRAANVTDAYSRAIGPENRYANYAGASRSIGDGMAPGFVGPAAAARPAPRVRNNLNTLREQQAAIQRAYDLAEIGSKSFNSLGRALNDVNTKIEKTESKVRASKGKGGLFDPNSRLSSAIIGGGFPLITGGGAALFSAVLPVVRLEDSLDRLAAVQSVKLLTSLSPRLPIPVKRYFP